MKIIVNHVTRMTSESRICVAGIDAATSQHVRPVTPSTDLITRALLRENGGPFGVGALVDLGAVVACPNAPETEDHEFATGQAKRIEDLSDDTYLELLDQVSDEDVPTAFGPDLVEVRPRKLAIPAGRGNRSLAVVPVVNPELQIRFGNLYLKLDPPNTPADLRVTDVRFYEADHSTVKRAIVNDVNGRFAAGEPVYAMLGLARAMHDSDGGNVHWLMANGLCLADRAVGDVP
jgi:Dual OB-containing domain